MNDSFRPCGPAHWAMQLEQFAARRRRAESLSNGAATTPANAGAGLSGESALDSAAGPA
jgi:hypothetical protein